MGGAGLGSLNHTGARVAEEHLPREPELAAEVLVGFGLRQALPCDRGGGGDLALGLEA